MGKDSNVIAFGPRSAAPIAPGGDGPHDGGMEARVTRLETDVGKIREDVATIKERLSHMPTTAQFWKAVAASSASIILALAALAAFFAKPWVEHLIAQMNKAAGP